MNLASREKKNNANSSLHWLPVAWPRSRPSPCLASSARRRIPTLRRPALFGPYHPLVQCPTLISLLRYQWTSDGWEDPLEAPALDPWRGYAGEDCSDAFDDEGFSEWYFDQE